MNTDEAYKLLSMKSEELRKLYIDLIEENKKLKEENEKLKKSLSKIGRF